MSEQGPYRIVGRLALDGQGYCEVTGPGIGWPGGDDTLAEGLNIAFAAGVASVAAPVAPDEARVEEMACELYNVYAAATGMAYSWAGIVAHDKEAREAWLTVARAVLTDPSLGRGR